LESKNGSTISSDELNESNTNSNLKENLNFYNQINKIKKKWENFSNSTRVSNSNESNNISKINASTFVNSEINNYEDIQNNNLNVSQMTLRDIKNKWNQISNKTNNRQNLNNTNFNDKLTHSINTNNTYDSKRKSIKK